MSDIPVKTQDPNLLGQLGAFGASAANSAAFGAPEFITNLIGGKDAYKKFIAANNQPILGVKPEDAGNMAGLVGSMFIPGGAILKGVGAGAKLAGAAKLGTAAEKGAQFLAGGGEKTLGNAIKRGAGQALEQAVPRAAIEGTNEVVNDGTSVPDAVKHQLGNVALSGTLGGGVGGALHGLGGVARWALGSEAGKGGRLVNQNIAQELKEGGAAQAVSGVLGTTTRDLRLVAQQGANFEKGNIGKAKAVEQAIQNQADVLDKYKIHNLQDLDDLHDQVKQSYDKIVGVLNEANTPVPKLGDTSVPDWLHKTTAFQSFARLHKDWQSVWENYKNRLLDEAERGSPANRQVGAPESDLVQNLWHVTAQDANGLRFGQSGDDQVTAKLADVIHEALNKRATELASEAGAKIELPPGFSSLEEMNKFYHDNAVYRATKRNEATRMEEAAPANSATAMRQSMINLASNAGPGALIGGTMAASQDPTNIPGIIGGTVVGGMLNKGVSGIANKIGGDIGLGLNRALGGGATEALDTKLGQQVTGARDFVKGIATGGQGVPGALAKTPGFIPSANTPQIPATVAGGPNGPSGASMAPMMAPGGGGQQGVPGIPQPPQQDAVGFLQSKGQYGQAVGGALMRMYQTIDRTSPNGTLRAQGVTPQMFIQEAMGMTNNFDPAIMANVLFNNDSQRKEFLTSYQQVNQLKSLNVDAMIQSGPFGGIGGPVLNGNYANTRNQLAQILSQNGDATKVKNALNQIDQIQWMGIPVQEKRRAIANLLQRSLKINAAMIRQYGLDQGSILDSIPDNELVSTTGE